MNYKDEMFKNLLVIYTGLTPLSLKIKVDMNYYYQKNYPYEYYVAYLKTYYDKYSLRELCLNYKKYINKEIIDDNYDLYKAGLLIKEAYSRGVKLDTLDLLETESLIGLTSKKLLSKIKLKLRLKNILDSHAFDKAFYQINIIYDYYKNDYDSISRYEQCLIDELDFIEYELKNKKIDNSTEYLSRINDLKNKIYSLK